MKNGTHVENAVTGERGRVKSHDEIMTVVSYGEKVGERLEMTADLRVLAVVDCDLGDEQG
jgi:hypothetical protein